MSAPEFQETAPEAFGFRHGLFHCEDVSLNDILNSTQRKIGSDASPLFVYSHAQLVRNARRYLDAMKESKHRYQLNYSIKANSNLTLLKEMVSLGISATLVSGHELNLALLAGFDPSTLIFNGCGKNRWETKLAIEKGTLLNVDNLWDLGQTIDQCRLLGRHARVLLRLNFDIDPNVHAYINTGHGDSKFGMSLESVEECLKLLQQPECPCELVGLHSHLGSTICDTSVFHESVRRLLEVRESLTCRGFHHVNILNAGGGLGIDYLAKEPETRPWRCETQEARKELLSLLRYLREEVDGTDEQLLDLKESIDIIRDQRQTSPALDDLAESIAEYVEEKISANDLWNVYTDVLNQSPALEEHINRICPCLCPKKKRFPSPAELVSSISDLLQGHDDICLVLEPGRSLVGNTGVILSRVMGSKGAQITNFAYVDASMTDILRPSLYGAYHHVTIIPSQNKDGGKDKKVYNVVGPVCESADFIAKDRLLVKPDGGLAVIHDVGAYGFCMASNYNMRMRPAEILIKHGRCHVIRKPDTLQHYLVPYVDTDDCESSK